MIRIEFQETETQIVVQTYENNHRLKIIFLDKTPERRDELETIIKAVDRHVS